MAASKLDAARTVVAEALESWPAGKDLAVIAYGHRRQGDCADIETIVEMSPVSTEAVSRSLASLMARGKTPLGASLRHAAAVLPPGGGSIILVSDGLETCDADPCAEAAALSEANANLFIHVVGFGLAAGEAEQLACIAENADGRFFDAESVDDLASALTTVTEVIVAAPAPAQAPSPPPAPAAKIAVAPAPMPAPPRAPLPSAPRIVPTDLVAVAGGLGRIVDAPVRWRLSDEGGRSVYEGESRSLALELQEGSYKVTAEAANARGEITIAVAEARTWEVAVPAGRLDLALAANASAAPYGDTEVTGVSWSLEPLEGQGPVDVPPLARPSLLLAPGPYLVRASLKELESTARVEVQAGAPVSETLHFALGTVILEAALDADTAAIADAAMVEWQVGEGVAADRIEGQARPRLVLPEGSYPVVLSVAGGEVRATAAVRAAEERVVRVVVGGGQLTLSARLGPQSAPLEDWRDTYWTLVADGGIAAGTVIDLPEARPTVPLSPGHWRIGLRSGVVVAEERITVAPGEDAAVSIDLGAARLTARADPSAGENAANTVYSFFALGPDGTPADTPAFEGGSSDGISTILPAGPWRVVAQDSDGRSGTADVSLGPGEERSLNFVLN